MNRLTRHFSFSITALLIVVAAGVLVAVIQLPQKASALPMPQNIAQAQPKSCTPKTFLGLVPWYNYLELKPTEDGQGCTVNLELSGRQDGAKNLNKIWLIALAILEDMMRIAAVLAVGFVIYGGFRYITSQGEPENIKAGQRTIIAALIGLVIAVVGATVTSFLARSLGG